MFNEWIKLDSRKYKQFITKYPKDIFIGLDTEYNAGDNNSKVQTISVQFAIVYKKTIYGIVYDADNYFKLRNPKLKSVLQSYFLFLKEIDKKTRLTKKTKTMKLSTHFSKADLRVLYDDDQLKNIKETLLPTKKTIILYDNNRNKIKLNQITYDTHLFNIYNVKSLKKLAKMIGLEKIEISQDQLNNMQLLKQTDPKLFFNYALNDSVISACAGIIQSLSLEKLGKEWGIDLTDTKTAPSLAKKYLTKTRPDITEKLRVYKQPPKDYDPDFWFQQELLEAGNSYYGGIQEALIYGIKHGVYNEIDLKSAYPVAASIIPMCDFKKSERNPVYLTSNLQFLQNFYNTTPDEVGRILGFYKTRFRSGVKLDKIKINFQPLFTKRMEIDQIKQDVVFRMLNGETYCTRIELEYYAWLMDTYPGLFHIDYVNGYEFEEKDGYLLKSVFAELIKKRREYEQKGDKELSLSYKLIANSLTGKFGQGIIKKKQYSWLKDETVVIPMCEISNPFIISQITAWIRIIIHSLVNYKPEAVTQIATDGILTSENIDFYQQQKTNPFVEKYISTTKNLGFKNWLESKKSAEGVIVINQSTSIGIKKIKNQEIICQTGLFNSGDTPIEAKKNIDQLIKGQYKRINRSVEPLRELRKSKSKHPKSKSLIVNIKPYPNYKKRIFNQYNDTYIGSDPFFDENEAIQNIIKEHNKIKALNFKTTENYNWYEKTTNELKKYRNKQPKNQRKIGVYSWFLREKTKGDEKKAQSLHKRYKRYKRLAMNLDNEYSFKTRMLLDYTPFSK